MDVARKSEREEKGKGGWKFEHPHENLTVKWLEQERSSTDEFSYLDSSGDIAMDLSSSAKHEKKRLCLNGGRPQPKLKEGDHWGAGTEQKTTLQ